MLVNRLNDAESDCSKFLMSKLGISGSRLATTIQNMRAFDALASTITMANAGLAPHIDFKTGKRHIYADAKVSDYFGSVPTTAAQALFASREDHGASQLDVYWRPYFEMADVVHEALHVFLGLDDEQLAGRLGVTITGTDSSPLSEAMKAGGCG